MARHDDKCFTPRNLTNIWKYAAPAVLVKCQCSNSKSKVWTVATNAQKHGTLNISRTNKQASERASKQTHTHTFRGVDWSCGNLKDNPPVEHGLYPPFVVSHWAYNIIIVYLGKKNTYPTISLVYPHKIVEHMYWYNPLKGIKMNVPTWIMHG